MSSSSQEAAWRSSGEFFVAATGREADEFPLRLAEHGLAGFIVVACSSVRASRA